MLEDGLCVWLQLVQATFELPFAIPVPWVVDHKCPFFQGLHVRVALSLAMGCGTLNGVSSSLVFLYMYGTVPLQVRGVSHPCIVGRLLLGQA